MPSGHLTGAEPIWVASGIRCVSPPDRVPDALRSAAEQETGAAQRRVAEADRRAQQLEDATRDRWDSMRAETENPFEHLQIAERRFAERVRHVEEVLAAVRTEFQPRSAASRGR